MSRQATAVVTQVSPLRIRMLGDTVSIPADSASSYTPVVGARVRVEARRSGLPPIVQFAVSS